MNCLVKPKGLCGEVLTVVDTDYSLAPNDSQAIDVNLFDPALGGLVW